MPKGVMYSHRSTYLHTFACYNADGIALSERDTVLPVVPMFHANAWGLAHAVVGCGANVVLPGANLTGKFLAELIEKEKVTVAAGVPTIWMGLLPELKGRDTSSLRLIPCGGSAVPKALSVAYRKQIGLSIFQAWGMTETSPVGSACMLRSTYNTKSEDELDDIRTSCGRPVLGVDIRITSEAGQDMPWDGTSRGEIQVHGPWVASGYYKRPQSEDAFTKDGWLRTGDVGTINKDGYIRIVDRLKDVIKSGGEWISSNEVENEIMAHPKVAEACVVAVQSTKWMERPYAWVVLRKDQTMTPAELMQFLTPRLAKWWLPDGVEFVTEVPKTSVGKFDKKVVRDKLKHVKVT